MNCTNTEGSSRQERSAIAVVPVVALEGVLVLVESHGVLLGIWVLLLGLLERSIEVVSCLMNGII
jgi:hypothetical protein